MKRLLLVFGVVIIALVITYPVWGVDFYHKGYDLWKNKRYCEAATTLEKAIPQYSDDYNLHYLIGYSYYYCKKFTKVLDPLDRSINLASKPKDVYKSAFMLGSAYLNLRKPDNYKALVAFKKALEAKPSDFNASYYAGKVSMNLKDYNSAIQFLKSALKNRPDHLKSHLLIGISYRRLDDLENSSIFLERVLELDPTNDAAPLYLCLDYIKQKKYEDARRIGLIAIKNIKGENLALAYSYLAQAELVLKDLNNSITHFKKLLEMQPENPGGYYHLGQAYEIKKSFKLALKNYKKAVKLDPKNCDYIYKVAHGYELTKQDCVATKWYKKCLKCPSTGSACKERLKWAKKRCQRKWEER